MSIDTESDEGVENAIPTISVVVPAYNEPGHALQALHDSLVGQTLESFEVIVVDDCSSAPEYGVLTDSRFRVVYQGKNSGPAAARNRGAREARAAVLFFTDADCRLDSETLRHVQLRMSEDVICMGETITVAHSFVGTSVGYLGFPGGGIIGFASVWPVDDQGFTDSITSCNLAMRSGAFTDLGGFDETFPVAAGEDTMLARSVIAHGLRIRHDPNQIVYHEERSDLGEFVRWQITRGRGAYHVRRRVGRIGSYVGRRFRSMGVSIRRAGLLYGPVVVALFGLSLLCQLYGFRSEARRERRA